MSMPNLPAFYLKHLIKDTLSSVTLYVTQRCNLACRTCFVQPGSEEPALSFYENLARQLPRLMWLDIGGGEPFLRHDLPQICSLFDTAILGIPTNGYDRKTIVPMVKEIASRTRGRLVISLSVDGPEPMHDAIRGRGTWQRAWSTFEEVRGIDGVALKVNTVITGENLPSLKEFAAWVRSRGADGHSLMLLRGDPRDSSLRPPPPESLRDAGPGLLAELRGYRYAHGALGARLLWEYHRLAWALSVRTLQQKRQVVPCLAGRNYLVVWPNRTAGPCELLPPVGSLDDTALDALIRSPQWSRQCSFIAQGGCWCTHNCALLASILFHPPSLARIAFAAMGLS
ncbi:radical SAM protein [Candidatus Fermentibacteria bacterium]|nr:radical SAM protein [Candidatus Fermentibacteria bacterium]